jgi:hypothetical protein
VDVLAEVQPRGVFFSDSSETCDSQAKFTHRGTGPARSGSLCVG